MGMQDKTPLVSVIMGVHGAHLPVHELENAIQSVLNQTFSDFEFLICEEGSSFEIRQILENYAENDSRIQLVDGCGAFLLAQKLNRCTEAARGRLIARQDADDFSAANRFQRQVDYLMEHPECAFVGCNVNYCQNGKDAGFSHFPTTPQARDFLFVQPFVHPTLIFRKEVLTKVGGYCEDTRCDGCEDYDLLLRIYIAGMHGDNLPDRCFSYTLPDRGVRKRTWVMRWNEVVTRMRLFKQLGWLPWALPYVVKPAAVGLLPTTWLDRIKQCQRER